MKFLNSRWAVLLWFGIATKGLFAVGLLLSVSAVTAQTTSFDACVKELRQSVVSQGIQGAVFDRAMKGVESDPDVLKAFSFRSCGSRARGGWACQAQRMVQSFSRS